MRIRPPIYTDAPGARRRYVYHKPPWNPDIPGRYIVGTSGFRSRPHEVYGQSGRRRQPASAVNIISIPRIRISPGNTTGLGRIYMLVCAPIGALSYCELTAPIYRRRNYQFSESLFNHFAVFPLRDKQFLHMYRFYHISNSYHFYNTRRFFRFTILTVLTGLPVASFCQFGHFPILRFDMPYWFTGFTFLHILPFYRFRYVLPF